MFVSYERKPYISSSGSPWFSDGNYSAIDYPPKLLKKLEGFSSVAYKDVVGIWTIGFGFIKDVKQGDTITAEEAEKRLKLELIPFEQCINENVHRDLTENQFSALVCFAYNIGAKAPTEPE